MRTSGIIPFSFQKSQTYKKIVELDFEHQVLAFQLMVSPHSHMSGLFSLPLGYLTIDTNRLLDDIERSIDALSTIGFLQYDYENSFIWVIDMALYQGGLDSQKDNRRKGTISFIRQFPDSEIKNNFINYYGLESEIPTSNNEALSKGLPRAYEGVGKVRILSHPMKKSLAGEIPNHKISENTPEFPEVNHAK